MVTVVIGDRLGKDKVAAGVETGGRAVVPGVAADETGRCDEGGKR